MLKDKLIVITGGAGRIGKALVQTVVEHGGIAILIDINEKSGNNALAVVQGKKARSLNNNENIGQAVFICMDVTSPNEIERLLERLDSEFGRIDALVNNAYPFSKNFYKKRFFELEMEDFNEFLNLHLGSQFALSQRFIRYFLKQGHGNIINISSIQGVGAPAFETYEGTDMHSPIEYTVAKHGLIGMTKYMAKMFKKDGIRVNAISPGGILDNQPEPFLSQYKKRCGTKGMLDSHDLAGALLFLLSDGSTYVNGQNIIIDDGFGL